MPKKKILCLALVMILVGSLVFAANIKIVDKKYDKYEDNKLVEFRVEDEYGAEVGKASYAPGGWNCFCGQSGKMSNEYVSDKQDAIQWILNNCPKS